MHAKENDPLQDLDQWDDDVRRRYPDPADGAATAEQLVTGEKRPDAFRNYTADTRPGVIEFYRLNHTRQTVDFVKSKRAEYLPKTKRRMSIWEAMQLLEELVDDSDPDTDVSQSQHAMQTAEAIREGGHPDWFILTGLIHDLGKVLCLWGEPQWAVVGDTFPVGCRFSEKIVYHEFFADNPDARTPAYQTRVGIYEEGCGLDQVMLSWGHDEYLYHVVKDHLPDEALAMIRYHSFYPAHREGAYQHLMNDHDRAMFTWVRRFNPYDLYTKSHEPPDVEALRPFYEKLIEEFFPSELVW